MGKLYIEYIEGSSYSCKVCRSSLAKHEELVSKHFHSRLGKAYLFNQVVNVLCGPYEERLMTTGVHVVCDIYCSVCLHNVGWKYVEAHDKSQKYKEGKFILERVQVCDLDKVRLYGAYGDDSDSEGS